MKFNSFDELIGYLYGKDLSSLEFTIEEPAKPCTDSCDIDAKPEPAQITSVPVKFNSLSDKPVVEFQVGDESILVVDDFEYIPNACSTTKIQFFGRELTVGVCENGNGLPVVKFDVIINEESVGIKEFVLVTDADKYTNTIRLD